MIKTRALNTTKTSPHAIAGYLTLALIFVVSLTGVGAIAFGKWVKIKNWNTHKEPQVIIGKIHRYTGYIIFCFGLAANCTGLIVYQKHYDYTNDKRYVMSNILFCILLTIFAETIHQLWKLKSRIEVSAEISMDSISVEKFKTLSHQENRKLFILDNKVLDYGEYDKQHPGGRFTFHQNIGRGISKFFYGGFKLFNLPTERNWNHSSSAMAVLNSMAIGHLEGQGDVKPLKVRVAEKIVVNGIANTFRFESVDGKQVNNFKHWYSDLSVIGRHLIYSEDMV
jgi:cytochrome b involved in lipid metabolism